PAVHSSFFRSVTRRSQYPTTRLSQCVSKFCQSLLQSSSHMARPGGCLQLSQQISIVRRVRYYKRNRLFPFFLKNMRELAVLSLSGDYY
ncbi:hypothetical protein BaRGS_00037885, partial [Batillaria attramentaria]